MFEETNQTGNFEGEEISFPETLFPNEDGEPDSEANETREKGEAGNGGDAAEDKGTEANGGSSSENGENHATEESNGQGLEIKYNGEKRTISRDEARTLAQKGLNYDHVVEERDRNKSAYDFIARQAQAKNMTVEEYINRAEDRNKEALIESKIDELRALDDDASEETLRRLAVAELANTKASEERARVSREEAARAEEAERWNRLYKAAPELEFNADKIPEEVFNRVRNEGLSPLEAYYRFKAEKLETENAKREGHKTAQEKSIGSLSGAGKAKSDSFLEGFLGE